MKHSNKALHELKIIQVLLELPTHRLLQVYYYDIMEKHYKYLYFKEMVVRWNSTLKMVERLVEQRKAVEQYLVEKRMFDILPSQAEWSAIEKFKDLLAPFEEGLCLC